ncbi:MAG: YjjG family noncanonical pyrimidine nucleotidase [Bacteroidota bacterium]|nr:YjjG family noncanonical pyrimidine nucleotidase [Bacteroidota bacterium]
MYKHLFFDLDRTLWDFDTNSREVLHELSLKYKLQELGVTSTDTFITEYIAINELLWAEYRLDLIDKESLRFDRFHRTLQLYGINDRKLTEAIGNDYTSIGPQRKHLFPDAKEVLGYLSEKYVLHIITNGFEETQHIKMECSGLKPFFAEIITSERAGCKKPDKRIFDYSVGAAKTDFASSLMIGDCLEADIGGARNAGIHQVYFNPSGFAHAETPTYEIKNLKELLNFL